VLRIEFAFREKRVRYCGTGFVIHDRAHDAYLLTCAHLIGEKQWQTRYSVTMRTMNGSRRIDSLGSSLFVGASVDLTRVGSNGWPDMTQDLVIRPVAGSWIHPLPLAPTDPAVGDWVWAVGCEQGKPLSDEQLYPGRIVEVANGGYLLEKQVPFDPHGFSGGPVINRKGEVIGNVLAGGGKIITGATVTTLRQRLKAKGVKVD
jgi:S1-C subfamily serine protease